MEGWFWCGPGTWTDVVREVRDRVPALALALLTVKTWANPCPWASVSLSV